MPSRDLKHNVDEQLALNETFVGATETRVGAIIDVANYDNGVIFDFFPVQYSAGTFIIILQHSDDPTMADEVPIPSEHLIGSFSDLSISSAISPGDFLGTIGVVGCKRYVRVEIGAAGGTGSIISIVTKKREWRPTD